MAKKCIPLIDMELDESNIGEKIVKACSEWGCFRMVNHGVSMELMSEMKAVTRSLTDLPMEMKERNSHPEPGKGYTPPNMASLYFEGLSLYDIASPGAVEDFCSQVGASPHHREVLNKYAFALHDLAQFLGEKLMEGLGMNGELFKNWPCQLKMNKYNYGPETVGLTGAVMHTDPGFLTILQDDEIVNGLEAVDPITGELVPVDPIPGTLVVNVGDAAKAWSNGRFCNVKHRVQCYEATIRTSIALFVLAPRDEKVEAPPQLVESGHPCLYVPFHFEDYRKLRASTGSPTGDALKYFLAKSS
ncbi:2-oxoglutarate and oxygenase superfamily protein [Perilla frutescens var. frutescens]|nr:2-oxoglutarate and oxygenase superfamily protein [Perilla frutescens var. frutescens]